MADSVVYGLALVVSANGISNDAAINIDGAPIDRQETCKTFEERGLSRPVWTDEAQHLARPAR